MSSSSEAQKPSTFGPYRRVVTSHAASDVDGSNVQIHDSHVPLMPVLNGTAFIAPLFATLGLPTSNAHSLTPGEIESAAAMAPEVVMPGGVNCRMTDVEPNTYIQMHRTNSIDYNVVLAGEATLITPTKNADGSEGTTRTVVKAGELVVQTGTLHAWESGPQGARWLTVVVPAAPVKTKEGKELAEVDFK